MIAGANILQCAGILQCNRIFLPFQTDEQYGVAEVGELEEMRPDVILVDENTLWGEGSGRGFREPRQAERPGIHHGKLPSVAPLRGDYSEEKGLHLHP